MDVLYLGFIGNQTMELYVFFSIPDVLMKGACMYKWQEKTLITVRKQTFALIATFCRKYNRGTIRPNRVLPLGGGHWVEMGLEG